MYLKHIPMDGPQNFRDLGGFLNKQGKVIKWEQLFRADGLSQLSENDIAKMKARNIRTIVDLRGKAEQEAHPDIVPEGMIYYPCPMMREDVKVEEGRAQHSFMKSMKQGYLNMINEGADLIGNVVKVVMEALEQGAVVFHCSAGKDRTGILSAVLLLVLDAYEQDIVADYQVSYTYNERGVNRYIESIPEMKSLLESSGEDSVMHSNPKNMRAVLEIINADNIQGWLEALGVSKELQNQFRQKMLI